MFLINYALLTSKAELSFVKGNRNKLAEGWGQAALTVR